VTITKARLGSYRSRASRRFWGVNGAQDPRESGGKRVAGKPPSRSVMSRPRLARVTSLVGLAGKLWLSGRAAALNPLDHASRDPERARHAAYARAASA
jgi:hypothetical protein